MGRKHGQKLLAGAATAVMLFNVGVAEAASCGNDGSGFARWLEDFKREAPSKGISPAVVDRALSGAIYNRPTIRADRGQKSFKLSFDEFMKKRGGQAIISRGKSVKSANAALFANIERRFGVPAGPLIAIWGMETGFGSYMGDQPTLSAVATLAYDCRRSAYFTEQLYAALQLVGRGDLSPSAKVLPMARSAKRSSCLSTSSDTVPMATAMVTSIS